MAIEECPKRKARQIVRVNDEKRLLVEIGAVGKNRPAGAEQLRLVDEIDAIAPRRRGDVTAYLFGEIGGIDQNPLYLAFWPSSSSSQ